MRLPTIYHDIEEEQESSVIGRGRQSNSQQVTPSRDVGCERRNGESREGLNIIEMLDPSLPVRACDIDLWWHPPACFA